MMMASQYGASESEYERELVWEIDRELDIHDQARDRLGMFRTQEQLATLRRQLSETEQGPEAELRHHRANEQVAILRRRVAEVELRAVELRSQLAEADRDFVDLRCQLAIADHTLWQLVCSEVVPPEEITQGSLNP